MGTVRGMALTGYRGNGVSGAIVLARNLDPSTRASLVSSPDVELVTGDGLFLLVGAGAATRSVSRAAVEAIEAEIATGEKVLTAVRTAFAAVEATQRQLDIARRGLRDAQAELDRALARRRAAAAAVRAAEDELARLVPVVVHDPIAPPLDRVGGGRLTGFGDVVAVGGATQMTGPVDAESQQAIEALEAQLAALAASLDGAETAARRAVEDAQVAHRHAEAERRRANSLLDWRVAEATSYLGPGVAVAGDGPVAWLMALRARIDDLDLPLARTRRENDRVGALVTALAVPAPAGDGIRPPGTNALVLDLTEGSVLDAEEVKRLVLEVSWTRPVACVSPDPALTAWAVELGPGTAIVAPTLKGQVVAELIHRAAMREEP